jgi:hypothetical protein
MKVPKNELSGENTPGKIYSNDPQLHIIRIPERIVVHETQQLSFRQPWYIEASLVLPEKRD